LTEEAVMAIRWSIKTDEQNEDQGVLLFAGDGVGNTGSWEMLIGSQSAGELGEALYQWAEGEGSSYEGTIG
jgi:hypothetical protein